MEEVSNTKNWPTWDSMLNTVDFISIEPRFRIYHLTFHGIWPIGARDIVYFETNYKQSDGCLMLATIAMDYSDYPITDAFVRAVLRGGGWHIRPVKDKENQCTVTYFMNTDPKLPIIPTWVMNLAATRFPGVIDKVREDIKKKDALKRRSSNSANSAKQEAKA